MIYSLKSVSKFNFFKFNLKKKSYITEIFMTIERVKFKLNENYNYLLEVR